MERFGRNPGATRLGSALAFVVLCSVLAPSAGALSPGDAAPPFDLPWLATEGGTRAPECFAEAPVTVLLIWDRGCPHCLELALSSGSLADSIAPRGARVLGIVLGPDDPEVVNELLWERQNPVPHLWDRDRRTAGAYDLGIKHIGIFVIDRSGMIRAHFDDKVAYLTAAVAPAVMDVFNRLPEGTATNPQSIAPINAATKSAPAMLPPGWPTPRIDCRNRLMSTENAQPLDTGFYGERLQNGTLFLYRWDLRLVWEITPHLVLEPWLRVGNESDAVLTEGAEQLTNKNGSVSLRYTDRFGEVTLGAYPLHLSPLTLQRWDLEDVPPIGGGAGGVSCGCGGGALGLKQNSLEILGPDYTFEGANAILKYPLARLHGWIAIPRMEDRGSYTLDAEAREAHYRRIVYGGALELGKPGREDRTFGLPTPIGLRAGVLRLEDDKRTLESLGEEPPPERDERVLFALGTLGPWQGFSADAEYADLRAEGTNESHGRGFRAGIRGERALGETVLWGRVHRLKTEDGFDPFYRALTFEPNREGYRGAIGVRFLPSPGAAREWLGLTLFLRRMRETTASTEPRNGSPEWATCSISLSTRPMPDLLAEAHWIFLREKGRPYGDPEEKTSGIALDARWEGVGTLDPMLRVEAIRPEDGTGESRTVWNTYVSVRILK
jgi:hypothetical protein